MTKKLEELFDVAPADELDITAEENSAVVEAVTADDIPQLDRKSVV